MSTLDDMSRVLICNMPFSNLRWPNIGPSLLKAALAERGIGCDIAYLNFDFAERVGLDNYAWIADGFAFVLGGERMFAKRFFQGQLPDDHRYWREVLLPTDSGLTDRDRADLARIERQVEPFLDGCMERVDWSQYTVVGFAASFQQTLASMCLARRIKRVRPEMKIVFGGAACEGEMGVELLRRFPVVDYVFLGEADLSFPQVVEQILAGGPVQPPPGVAGRDSLLPQPPAPPGGWAPPGGRAHFTRPGIHDSHYPPAEPGAEGAAELPTCRQLAVASNPGDFLVRDLNALPYPDFDDYFARLDRSPLKNEIDCTLFFETSRGCWWGQKHHCKFCGLNGATLLYRSKSPRRAVDELRYLVGRHGVHRACSADNILDHRYFNTFLPMLKDAGIDLAFVYEMKTNITREQVQILMDAGMGAAQLGIETFITPVLRLIGKGANAIQNLQALKWFSEQRIEVKWNVLYGFPGEDPADYAAMAELLPSLVHLAPPLAAGRVRLDRFSPYFEDPAAHGMANPRPNRAFGYVYPFPSDALARLAYYYEYDYADGRNPLDYATPVLHAIQQWQSLAGSAALNYYDRDDGVLILTDTRPCATDLQHRLTGLDREIYLYCDTARSMRKIAEFAQQQRGGGSPDESRFSSRGNESRFSLLGCESICGAVFKIASMDGFLFFVARMRNVLAG